MSKGTLTEDLKKEIIHNLNIRIGADVDNLNNAYEIENELVLKRNQLQNTLHEANDEVPTKLSSTIKKAELNSKQIESIREKREALMKKTEGFLSKIEPFAKELDIRFSAIGRLEGVLAYFKSYARIVELSNEMKQCKDDEQLVILYGELKKLCSQYQTSHRGTYIKEYTHYWHIVLKDKLIKHYEDVLKLMKWPITSAAESSPFPKEVLNKFSNLTRYLFLIQEPRGVIWGSSGDIIQGTELYCIRQNMDYVKVFHYVPLCEEFGQDPCLPVKVLLKPLKKRFAFHFTGSRQTARIDRPEWFLTQTLTWIKDHQDFVRNNVQPIAEKLEMKDIDAVDEFNSGLIALAAERLHTVLAIYHTQGTKGEMVDVDAAFAHAVDETLGFHKELAAITDNEFNSVISVLTKAENFVRWLAVEKKYALAKMDETLDNEQWIEAVAAGVGAAVGSVLWVPRGADWMISLLKTIEDRYAMLPQPGHRLQFLELQLELIEEWRVRLTQLLNAANAALKSESFLVAGPHPLIAIINAAHHTRTVLLQWAHSLHYLQLHYYRRQFNQFTQQQHRDEEEKSIAAPKDDDGTDETQHIFKEAQEEINDDNMSLNEVEESAKKLALHEITQRRSVVLESSQNEFINESTTYEPLLDEDAEDGGVFGDAPTLLGVLRETGVKVLVEHILLEFKATIRDYKKQKWHSMVTMEQVALSVSSPLCGPLSSLCARLSSASQTLAPRLATQLRAQLAIYIDNHLFEEVVLENWFNTGGTIQFTHDVMRNIVPAFAPPNKNASQLNQLTKVLEACKLLNLDYDDARRLRFLLVKLPDEAIQNLLKHGIVYIEPKQAAQILIQRTDLNETTTPSSVMELF